MCSLVQWFQKIIYRIKIIPLIYVLSTSFDSDYLNYFGEYCKYYIVIMMRTNISVRLLQRFAIEKKLFVYDSGVRDGNMDYNKP